jgi:3-oxoacyl-[acyl-carrier protein] reductase
MSDWYQQLTNSTIGRQVTGLLGLPAPVPLRRYEPGAPLVEGPVLVGAADGGIAVDAVSSLLDDHKIDVRRDLSQAGADRFGAVIYDATGITSSADTTSMFEFFNSAVRAMGRCARMIVIGLPPGRVADVSTATVAQALEGFVRSAAKEMRNGSTANLLRVGPDATHAIDSTLRFLLSGRSAYVSGQVIEVDTPAGEVVAALDLDRPLDGKVALVTGAAQGIGEAIARTLARDGAHVVGLDVPGQGERLTTVVNEIGGSALQLDITDAEAPAELAAHVRERHGEIDIVVHNAGITRDKTLAGMDAARWDAVMAVNLTSQERINEALLGGGLLAAHGRIVSVSSFSGIAGNRGQTNYAASKAGIIGMVRALAPRVAEVPATINAVAPGFIETDMTDAMPFVPREVGRRMNSLNQGGTPIDVAETIAWLADPGSSGVNGQVVRVCGQMILGA